MAKFCTECGAELTDGQKFCTECGARQDADTAVTETAAENAAEQSSEEAASNEEPQAVTNDTDTAAAVPDIGTKTQSTSSSVKSKKTPAQAIQSAAAVLENNTFAVSAHGESAIGSLGAAGGMPGAVTPSFPSASIGAVKAFFTGIIAAFKDPKTIITVAVVAAVQFLVRLLLRFGIGGVFTNFLSVLTFARFGLGKGVLSKLGGVCGEAVFVSAIASIFRGGFGNAGRGIKNLFRNNENAGAAPIIFGIVLAVILFTFFAGGAGITKIMCAAAMLFVNLQIMGRKSGILYDLAASLVSKANNDGAASGLLTGMCIGSAAAVIFSVLGLGRLPLLICIPLVISGIVLVVLTHKKDGDKV